MQREIKVYAQGHITREHLDQDLKLDRATADKIIHYTWDKGYKKDIKLYKDVQQLILPSLGMLV